MRRKYCNAAKQQQDCNRTLNFNSRNHYFESYLRSVTVPATKRPRATSNVQRVPPTIVIIIDVGAIDPILAIRGDQLHAHEQQLSLLGEGSPVKPTTNHPIIGAASDTPCLSLHSLTHFVMRLG